MKEKYKITLKEIEYQPILFVNLRNMKIYLPPELCRDCSLPEDFTKNKNAMRDIAASKIKDPAERFERLQKILKQISGH